MKIVKSFSRCFFASVLFTISFFPKEAEAKDWAPIPEDPSLYFFIDQQGEWILIEGVRNKDGSFQEGMIVYRGGDGKNFFPLIIEGIRVEEVFIGENPIRREWVILKDPKSKEKYEFFHSKMGWTRESSQNYEVLFLKSPSFGDGNQSVREYNQTYLSCGEIKSLNIHKQ